jgi:hypothetical protein
MRKTARENGEVAGRMSVTAKELKATDRLVLGPAIHNSGSVDIGLILRTVDRWLIAGGKLIRLAHSVCFLRERRDVN